MFVNSRSIASGMFVPLDLTLDADYNILIKPL